MTSPAAVPSAVPLRPLGVAEILDGGVRIVGRNARAAFTMSVPFAIVRTGLIALLQLATYDTQDAAQLQLLGLVLVSGVFGTILTGLLAPVFTGELMGRRLTAAQALTQVGRGGAIGLVLLALVVAVPQEIGLLLLAVGGVWLWGIWAVAAPALTVERIGVRRALGRSFELVKSSFWRTWGIRTLRWVLTSTLGLFITLPFTLLAAYLADTDLLDQAAKGIGNPGLYVTILAIGRLLSVAVTSPISAAVDALLYTDLRMRREGMDLVLALPPLSPEVRPDDRPAVTAW